MGNQILSVNDTFDLPAVVQARLDARYRQLDKGENFLSHKTLKTGDFAAGIAGDSTANAADEAMDLYIGTVATADPSLTVEIPHWNDVTQAYSPASVIQTGTSSGSGVVYLDNFNRTAADLYATQPDIGAVWGRDGSNAAGDWSLDGSKAQRTADATAGTMLADALTAGDQRITVSGQMSTVAGAATRQNRFYLHYVSASDHLYLSINTTTTGLMQWKLYKRIANVVTEIASGADNKLAASTANQAFSLVVEKNGFNVNATLNGTTITGALVQADRNVLDAATKAGFSGCVSGDYFDAYQIEILNVAPPRKLTFYNASQSGSILTYQQTRLAAMFPAPLDVLFVNSCHNYGAQTPAQYEAALDSFLDAFRAVRPEAGIIIMSQNPEKPPAANRAAHLARLASLRSYCARRGYGYIPVIEAFTALGDGGASLVQADGIHPTTGAASGANLWRDTITSYFTNLA